MTQEITKDTNIKSHLKDIALLFAIPVGIALLAATVIYIPRLFAHPKYDFIYSACDNYRCRQNYTVEAGHVARGPSHSSDSDYYDYTTRLLYYSSAADSTRSITLEEAQQYSLDTSSKSPDGYVLSKENSSSGFLFLGRADSGWYLKDGAKKKRVELASDSSYYSQNVTFLGWVKK
jgi:hypothetical protein